MKLPVFTAIKFVDGDGYLTPSMQFFFDNLIQTLTNGLSDNGWTFPQITAAELAKIEPQMPNGTAWYETDNHEIVFKVNGALVKLVTAAYP